METALPRRETVLFQHNNWLFGHDETELEIHDGAGVWSSHAADVFSLGHCHSLALAIHSLTGCEMYAVRDWEGEISHVVAVMPGSLAVLDAEAWRRGHEGTLDDYDTLNGGAERIYAEDIYAAVEGQELWPLRDRDAEPWARSLLAYFGMEHLIEEVMA